MLERLGPKADPLDAARAAFETIGLAKVATSAHEARVMGFLRDRDVIVLGRKGDIGQDPDFVAGRISPQDEASQLVVELLDPQPGEAAWGHDTPVAEDGTFDVTEIRRLRG